MKILCLPDKEGKVRFSAGVFFEQIDKNHCYEVSVYSLQEGSEVRVSAGGFRTYYVMAGSVRVTLSDAQEHLVETKTLGSEKGWLLLPTQSQLVHAEADAQLFVIENTVSLKEEELTERGQKRFLDGKAFNELSDYTVHKPWGSEQWFVDTGVYVFKGIRMNAGFECSLQLHEQKIEVNLLMSGRAQLLLGQSATANAAIAEHHKKGGNQANFSMPGEEVETLKKGIKSTVVSPGEGWKADVYDIHQVLSLETYYALEVSTPEVDDIIRLKDLYHRPGGRIESEHAQK